MRGLARHQWFGNGINAIAIDVGRLNKDQFIFMKGIGVVFTLAFVKLHGCFLGKDVGGELAQDEQDQPCVDDEDPNFLFAELKSARMGCEQIDQEHASDKIASGKDGYSPL